MKNTIQEAMTFINQPKNKKSLRTKTMTQTIKQGKDLLKVAKKKIEKKKAQINQTEPSRSKSVKSKAPKKKGKKIQKK